MTVSYREHRFEHQINYYRYYTKVRYSNYILVTNIVLDIGDTTLWTNIYDKHRYYVVMAVFSIKTI